MNRSLLPVSCSEKNKISMENSGGPNFGIPEGGGPSEKDTGWQESFKRHERPQSGTKGSGKGGKGADLRARVAVVSILSQGDKITSSKHKIYAEHDLFTRPLVVSNDKGIPIAHNSIADHADQHTVRLATQKGLGELHEILIKAHGPLHLATTPGKGELTVVKIRIRSEVLFSDAEWPQIMTVLFPAEFVGFVSGSPMEVVQFPGEAPKCTMHALVFKSERTLALQSTPMRDQITVMSKSRKQITWKADVYEMPIACPMPAIHVTDLQIAQRQFLPRKIFDNMVSRYKTALAQIFKCGAWKNRSHEDILAGFGCNYAARYNKDRSGVQGTNVFTLEISGYTEGGVIHMNQVLKDAQPIQVPC